MTNATEVTAVCSSDVQDNCAQLNSSYSFLLLLVLLLLLLLLWRYSPSWPWPF
jgi:hypothetical protein